MVNCTSIDWFLTWPDDALLAVSEQYLLQANDIISDSHHSVVVSKGGEGEGSSSDARSGVISAKGGRDPKDKTNLEVIAENEERDDVS